MDSGQFREWFQSQLARREWTQRDFSRRSGISPSTVSEWHRGTRVPDPASIELAALPAAPDRDAFAAAAATLGSIAGVITAASPADLRAILETVGTVVYGPDGVRVAYIAPFNSFVPVPWVVMV